jgi:hypothetical protein
MTRTPKRFELDIVVKVLPFVLPEGVQSNIRRVAPFESHHIRDILAAV